LQSGLRSAINGPVKPHTSVLALYEYPFNEGTRTMLRLEHLFARLGVLCARTDALDHHFALQTLFEIMDVASRADLKSEMLKELERRRSRLECFRGSPQVDEASLKGALDGIQQAYEALNSTSGKAGQSLASDEWLMSVRSRIAIPGGTCAFDLPAYFAWQHRAGKLRQSDLARWTECLRPFERALGILLGLLRESGQPQRVHAAAGLYQQRLPEGKAYQLLRVEVPTEDGQVPEISGHRLLVSVRLLRGDADGRLRPTGQDISLDLALCA
jgi:cell division protein ZapD